MILALADPDDLDGDGISGTPNWITTPAYITHRPAPVEQGGKHIGRFGRKGAAYDLLQQTANAYNQDIGITSNYEPVDTYTGAILDPEVSNSTVDQVVFYLLTLKAPIQRDKDDPQVIAGEQVFTAVGCAKCHTPELVTGPSPIAPLANKTVRPYSDLLLHDMGSGLDDGYTEGSALTSEWRTPPLWGLGLSSDSQGGSYFLLHDGRATTIEQAIEAHDGEGQASRVPTSNFQPRTAKPCSASSKASESWNDAHFFASAVWVPVRQLPECSHWLAAPASHTYWPQPGKEVGAYARTPLRSKGRTASDAASLWKCKGLKHL